MTMGRLDFRSVVSVVLLVVVMAYAGCSADRPGDAGSKPTPPKSPGTGPSPNPVAAVQPASPIDKLLADLDKPAAVLIVSGQQQGYMEPCGCSAEQIGGLIRRYDFIERLQQQKLPVALIELGSLLNYPANARGGLEQAKIKFDYAVKALKLLKYDGLALSADDLKVGVGEALGLFDNNLGEKTKILVANVQPEKVFEKMFRPSIVVTTGPLKLGITAVIDPDALAKLSDAEKDVSLTAIKPPDDVLAGVLGDLESRSDYQVLMVQGPPALAKRLGEAFPGFDIVVATSEVADPMSHDPELLNGGKTMLVSTGKKGKYVGVIGIHPNQEKPVRFHLVTLDRRFDGAAVPMKTLIENEYRETLKGFGVVENFVRRDGPPGATFVGAATCQNCHPNTFARWESTKHAKAFDALLHDPKPNTVFDAECITCHTTGFEFRSGWKSQQDTPYLAGNQCENCHGPASKHVSEPDNAEVRKLIHLTAEGAEKGRLCYSCHDEDNSRDFEFAKYYGHIVHKGLDVYTDPKVHQGITPAPKAAKPLSVPAR
jgi:hypothetical protein